MNFKGKDCVSHVPKCLAGVDECVDNSCKRRAEYLRCSLVIVHTEHSQWQASSIREKSVCLAEVYHCKNKFAVLANYLVTSVA